MSIEKHTFYLLMDEGSVFFEKDKEKIISNNTFFDMFGNKSFAEINCEETSVENIITEFKTLSFGAEKKTVILNNFQKVISNKTALNLFDTYLNKPVTDVIHILLSKEIFDDKKGTKPVKNFLKKLNELNAYIKPYKKSNEKGLKSWLNKEFQKEGYEIEPEAISTFIEYSGNNIDMLKTELEKVMVYKINDKTISINDIEEILQNIRMDLIFSMIDAIIEKNLIEFIKINNLLKYQQNYPIVHIMLLLENLETIYYCKTNNIKTSYDIVNDKKLKIYNKGRAYFLEKQLKTAHNIKIIKKIIKNIKKFDKLQKMEYFTNYNILMEELLF